MKINPLTNRMNWQKSFYNFEPSDAAHLIEANALLLRIRGKDSFTFGPRANLAWLASETKPCYSSSIPHCCYLCKQDGAHTQNYEHFFIDLKVRKFWNAKKSVFNMIFDPSSSKNKQTAEICAHSWKRLIILVTSVSSTLTEQYPDYQ